MLHATFAAVLSACITALGLYLQTCTRCKHKLNAKTDLSHGATAALHDHTDGNRVTALAGTCTVLACCGTAIHTGCNTEQYYKQHNC
jgi:hypothetical protein